jgi:putative membrane-bound dehydrogenase-like protein
MLEDTKGSGVYDKSTVYADNLPWPTAVFPWKGGLLVGCTPDIIYVKDTHGDGKADLREILFSGFASGVDRTNVQALMNSFSWGLDNRIHGATSTQGGTVRSVKHPDAKALDLHGRDFAIDPRAMTMISEAGGGQHGLSFDDYGRRFTCNNNDHIRLFMYDDRYAARNPFYSMPPTLASIAVDGPAAEVFRVSPEEPWRIIRTHWRVASLVTGPVEGGGRSSGYFTGATGITIYRGDAFPHEFLDNAFVAECAGNLVSRKVLSPDDVGLKAQRAADEQNVEFLASTDLWFRPVQHANGPDGALYVIDMHREIIEHPWALPPNLKKLLDLNSGNDCGRIFRIVPDGFKRPAPVRLDLASTRELVANLENPNGWHRDTAARLIYERQDKSAVPLLVKILETSKPPLARIHALYALDGLGALKERHVLRGMDDPEPWVRVHAIKLSEKFSSHRSSKIFRRLTELGNDSSNLVRYQLAFTLGEFKGGDITTPLAAIAKRDAASPWIQAAVLSSLSNGAGKVFATLSHDPEFCASKAGQDFLRQLVSVVGARNNAVEVTEVLAFIGKVNEPELSFALARALGEGLKRSNSSLEQADQKGSLKTILAQAQKLAMDQQTAEADRMEAIQLLAFSSDPAASQILAELLKPGETESIQMAVISTLARFPGPQVADEIIMQWSHFSPRVKSQAVSVLLARPERALILLQKIQGGAIPTSDLTTAQASFLRRHSDAAVRKLASQVLSTAARSRQSVVEAFQPTLHLAGNAAEGRKIFEQRCVSCHRLGGVGFSVGPDLVSAKSNGKDKLLVSILDPSFEVAPQYMAFDIETKDGESSVGIIANESPASVTVRQAYGKEDVIQRSNIKGMKSQTQSLMPEGLEAGLTQQDLANLLEYISTANADK